MNFIYPSAKDLMMTQQLNLLTAPIQGVFVSENYVPSYHHTKLDDIPAGCRVAFTGTLENRSVVNGVFSANPATANDVFGDRIKAVVLCSNTGTLSTSPLICYVDQSPNLPVSPNGGSLSIIWDTAAYRIFAI